MLKLLLKRRELSALIFLALIFLVVGAINPAFLTVNNILLCFNSSVVFAIVAIGIAFVIITGEIDVSVGATVGLSATVVGCLVRDGNPWLTSCLIGLAIGLLVGAVNGFGVVVFRIPSIIMTLGTNGIIRGLMYVYTDGKWVENIPFEFKALSQYKLFDTFTYFYLFVILIMILIHTYMTKAKKGKYFAAVGDNAAGANLLGIPVDLTKFIAFLLCGVFSSIGGIIFVSRVGFVTPIAGIGYEMKVIAACVIGGISLSGGVGNMIGAAIGAALMASISRLLVFIGLPSNLDDTITGILLIIIVVVDAIIRRNSIERARCERLSVKTSLKGEA
ncbi:MAG: ABC transporter permease [Eubacteriales bacterium]|nr:ABC transporter permease [Eubacteriales bacterium]